MLKAASRCEVYARRLVLVLKFSAVPYKAGWYFLLEFRVQRNVVYIYLFIVLVHCVCLCSMPYIWKFKDNFVGLVCYCKTWGWSLGHQAWQQAPLPLSPHHPFLLILGLLRRVCH